MKIKRRKRKMGNNMSKLAVGLHELHESIYNKETKKYSARIPSFDTWLSYGLDVAQKIVLTPPAGRFPAHVCELELGEQHSKWYLENAMRPLKV